MHTTPLLPLVHDGVVLGLHITASAPDMAAINTTTVDIISFACFILLPFGYKKTVKDIDGRGVKKSYERMTPLVFRLPVLYNQRLPDIGRGIFWRRNC
jgi:hypothetical protein